MTHALSEARNTLWRELGKLRPGLSRFARELATLEEPSECRASVERLNSLCKPSPANADRLIDALAHAAASLARAQDEALSRKARLKPGLHVELLEELGALLGLLASVAVCAWVPQWTGPSSATPLLTKLWAASVFLAGGAAQLWATARAGAYRRADKLARQLHVARAAILHAEALHTLASLSTGLSVRAQRFYAALLAEAPPPCDARAARDRRHAPATTCLCAASDKSTLCTVLLGIRATVISLPDEQARNELRRLLEAEARAADPGEPAQTSVHTDAEVPPFGQLKQYLFFRRAITTLQWSGPVCQNRLTLDPIFDAFLRQRMHVCGVPEDRLRTARGLPEVGPRHAGAPWMPPHP
ncbi:hypothetical protein [Pandoraea oxalativorans]|nr:hypothetical protein [Pandoraea oxalativorans]